MFGGALETLLGAFLAVMSFVATESRPGLLPSRDTQGHPPRLWERAILLAAGALFAVDGIRRLLR
jgi:hypothetical protein